jgi:gas vesicle structural protein
MAMAISTQTGGPSGGALTEVLELILDRGVVIDAFVRVSLVGIETLTIDARVVVASVDTYLRYAEAVGRVSLDTRKAGVPELVEGGKAKAAIEAAGDKYGDLLGGVLGQPEQVPEPEPRRKSDD